MSDLARRRLALTSAIFGDEGACLGSIAFLGRLGTEAHTFTRAVLRYLRVRSRPTPFWKPHGNHLSQAMEYLRIRASPTVRLSLLASTESFSHKAFYGVAYFFSCTVRSFESLSFSLHIDQLHFRVSSKLYTLLSYTLFHILGGFHFWIYPIPFPILPGCLHYVLRHWAFSFSHFQHLHEGTRNWSGVFQRNEGRIDRSNEGLI